MWDDRILKEILITCEWWLGQSTGNIWPHEVLTLSDAHRLVCRACDWLLVLFFRGIKSFVDPKEPTYCYCNQVSYGEMIACDNPEVAIYPFSFMSMDVWGFCFLLLSFLCSYHSFGLTILRACFCALYSSSNGLCSTKYLFFYLLK